MCCGECFRKVFLEAREISALIKESPSTGRTKGKHRHAKDHRN